MIHSSNGYFIGFQIMYFSCIKTPPKTPSLIFLFQSTIPHFLLVLFSWRHHWLQSASIVTACYHKRCACIISTSVHAWVKISKLLLYKVSKEEKKERALFLYNCPRKIRSSLTVHRQIYWTSVSFNELQCSFNAVTFKLWQRDPAAGHSGITGKFFYLKNFIENFLFYKSTRTAVASHKTIHIKNEMQHCFETICSGKQFNKMCFTCMYTSALILFWLHI